MEPRLDTRHYSAEEQLQRLLEVIDALNPGEKVVMIDKAHPAELIRRMEEVRPGQFNTGPLRCRPGEFHLEVARRHGDRERLVSELIGWDQRRLDDVLDDVDEMASESAFEIALDRYEDFLCGLRHHMSMEERLLFPLYEELTGDPDLIPIMHSEHVLIRLLADEVREALREEDLGAFAESIEQLHVVMDAHDQREEEIIYPRIDKALGRGAALNRVVQAMQAF